MRTILPPLLMMPLEAADCWFHTYPVVHTSPAAPICRWPMSVFKDCLGGSVPTSRIFKFEARE